MKPTSLGERGCEEGYPSSCSLRAIAAIGILPACVFVVAAAAVVTGVVYSRSCNARLVRCLLQSLFAVNDRCVGVKRRCRSYWIPFMVKSDRQIPDDHPHSKDFRTVSDPSFRGSQHHPFDRHPCVNLWSMFKRRCIVSFVVCVSTTTTTGQSLRVLISAAAPGVYL